VHLWPDPPAGKHGLVLRGHVDEVRCLAFNRDGTRLASAGADRVVHVWDVVTGKLIAGPNPKGKHAIAAFPRGGKTFLASAAGPTLRVWDTDTGDEVPPSHDGPAFSVGADPDGNRLAVGGLDYLSTGERDGAVCVWDLTTKEKTATFDNGVYAVAFDPTGRYLAGAGVNDRVYLWDVATRELVFELDGHQERINAVAFSPDGSYVLSGGDDHTVRVWDVLSGRLIVVREFDTPVQAIAFAPDGSSVFTGNGNTTCYRVGLKKLLED
jgi:WD40 repeat protein